MEEDKSQAEGTGDFRLGMVLRRACVFTSLHLYKKSIELSGATSSSESEGSNSVAKGRNRKGNHITGGHRTNLVE